MIPTVKSEAEERGKLGSLCLRLKICGPIVEELTGDNSLFSQESQVTPTATSRFGWGTNRREKFHCSARKARFRLRLHLALAERHIQEEGTVCLQASLHRPSPPLVQG